MRLMIRSRLMELIISEIAISAEAL